MIAIGNYIGKAINQQEEAPAWTPTADQLNLWLQGRSGLTMTDAINGNNATILPSYLYKPTGDEYAYIADAGGVFDVNNGTEFSLCAWVKSETTNKTAANYFLGKYLNTEPYGLYYMYAAATTGNLGVRFKTSANAYTRDTAIDFTSAGWCFVILEIDVTNSLARVFVNNVQRGADIAFTGTFANTTCPLAIGGMNNGGTYFIGKTSHSDTYIYNKILTPTEKTTLYNRGHVSGALAHWPCNSFNINDVSGNGYHMTGVNLTSAKVLRSISGSRHLLDKGYSLYTKAGEANIQVPYSDAGVELVTPTVPDGYAKLASFPGSLTVHNLADSLIDLDYADATPAELAVLDRSSETYQSAASRAASDYDAANVYRYLVSNLADPRILTTFFNTGYAGMPYQKITTELIGAEYYPKTLEEFFMMIADQTGADQYEIMQYCDTDVYAI